MENDTKVWPFEVVSQGAVLKRVNSSVPKPSELPAAFEACSQCEASSVREALGSSIMLPFEIPCCGWTLLLILLDSPILLVDCMAIPLDNMITSEDKNQMFLLK